MDPPLDQSHWDVGGVGCHGRVWVSGSTAPQSKNSCFPLGLGRNNSLFLCPVVSLEESQCFYFLRLDPLLRLTFQLSQVVFQLPKCCFCVPACFCFQMVILPILFFKTVSLILLQTQSMCKLPLYLQVSCRCILYEISLVHWSLKYLQLVQPHSMFVQLL